MRLRTKIKVFDPNSRAFFTSAHSFNCMGHSSWPRCTETRSLHGPSYLCALLYRRNKEPLYDWEQKGMNFVLLNQNYITYQFGFMIFPGNLLLLWENIKLEAMSVVKKERLVPPDVKAPRNGNKTKQTTTTAKIKIMRVEKKDQH